MEYLPGNIEIENKPAEIDVWDKISNIIDSKQGILGYKIPSLGERELENIPSFIIRSPKFGIVIIDVVDEKIIEFDEDNEYWKTESDNFIYSKDISINLYESELISRLKKNNQLFDIRTGKWKCEIKPRKLIVFPFNDSSDINALNESTTTPLINEYITSEVLVNELNKLFEDLDEEISDFIDVIDSVLDGSDVFRKIKRKKILDTPKSVNDFIKKSLDYTFKLDRIQRQVALQVPPGPQRIRGLAGTGKTVILCMKAALAHKAFPELKILLVFNTQSMYNQVKKTVTEYYFNEAKAMPNWHKLHILHAWGGSNKEGVYYNTANACGISPKTYYNVKSSDNPLEAIYSDLLENARSKIIPEYDISLIDEAQDFSPSFFETIFLLTKNAGSTDSKRIIWAYDEFQSLSELKVKGPTELFGLNSKGKPNMLDNALDGYYKGKIEKDFVLPNSYRNPRINLMVAHSLALGVYSKYGKVPMEDKRDWEARGYVLHSPQHRFFKEGDKIKVERPEKYSKNILEKLLRDNKKDDKKLIQFKACTDIKSELNEVIKKIDWLVHNQKVEPEEILVINLDTKNSKSQFEYVRQQLDCIDIQAITPGYVEKSDAFKESGLVTLSTAFRAKGNETNIVFVINSQRVINDSTFRIRNAIFVSITRSRGWCYIYGHGNGISDLEQEIDDMLNDYPYFNFVFPSDAEIRRKLTIIQSQKDVEKADKDIDKLLSEDAYRALLLEKLSQDANLLEELNKLKKGKNDD